MRFAEEKPAANVGPESDQDNPFPGLRPFLEKDKDSFFGRDGQVVELLARLRESRFLAILGTSGSGKSSLVYAGLFPALHGGMMRGAGSHWRIAEFRPGSRPLKNFSAALVQKALFRQEAENASAQWGTEADANDPFLEASVEATLRRSGLGLIDAVRLVGLPKNSNLLVVVDQFEELFRFRREALKVPPNDDAMALVRLLFEAAKQTELPIYVAITMRSEFLGECAGLPELPEAINRGQYLVPRMSRDERRLAIEGPVSVASGTIRSRLVQRLLNDAGDNPDQLPILQHALMRTWNAWKRDHAEGEPLDIHHYEAIHGMEALSLHAEEVLGELPTERHRALAEKMFKALTKVDAENRGIRNPASFGQLCAITGGEPMELATIIDAFRKPGRTFLMPPLETELQQDTIIDISHESLMRVWDRLRTWTKEEAQSARVYVELAKDARAGKSLYRDPELAAALKWQLDNQPSKAWGQRYDKEYDLTLDFLERSRRAREAQRRVKMVIGAAIIILLAVVGVFYFKIREGELRALSAQLMLGAAQYTADPQESLVLASKAFATNPSLAAEDVLREALLASNLRAVSSAHSHGNVQALFSPDGRNVASIGADGNVCVWKWKEGGQTKLIARHSGYVNALAFSADGTFVGTGDVDGMVVIADLALEHAVRTNKLHAKTIETLSFHPTENLILTGSQDRSARIWNWRQPEAASVTMPHPKEVTSAEFSPDGNLVLTACKDGAARIWDWRRAPLRELASLRVSDEMLKSAHFNSNGTLVATAGLDGNVRVWNWQDLSMLGAYPHGESSKSAVFHPDGHLILSVGGTSAGFDDFAVLFNWASPTNGQVQLRHPGSAVESAAFSHDGELVVTAGVDGTARVWSVQTGAQLAVLRGHSTQVDGAAFHPNGTNIVTACHDGQIRVWEFRRGHVERFNLTNQMDAIVSPDGRYAGMWRREDHAWLCETTSSNVVSIPTGAVDRLVFTPDSQGVVVVSHEGVSLWKIKGTNLEFQWTTNLSVLRIGAALSKNGEVAVTSADNTLTFCSVTGAEEVIAPGNHAPAFRSGGHSHAVIGVTTDSKGDVAILAFDDDNTLRRWSLRKIESRADSLAEILHLAFSPDDQSLLQVCKGLTSQLWDVKSRKITATLSGYSEQIDRAAFSPNGKFVVAGGQDHSIHLWSSRTGHRLATFPGDDDRWRIAEFRPDGLAVIAVSDQGKVWTVPCEELSEQFESLVQPRLVDKGLKIESKYALGR